MASQLTVKVHPLVVLTMVDAYERRSRKAGKDQSLGTLLGVYEKNAIHVTDCYAIPFRVSASDMPEIDDAFNKEMFQAAKRATPTEQIVGWFYTVAELPNICEQFHIYYSHVVTGQTVRRDLPPIILLTLDVNFSETKKGSLPIRAYMRTECGLTGGKGNHARIFQPLRVEIEGFAGENVALDVITKGIDSKTRETVIDTGLTPIDNGVNEMIGWLERILVYVDGVIESGKLPEDSNTGRRLLDIVDTAATLLQTDKRDNLIKNSLRDYMMISYLANLTTTQLSLQERMIQN